MHYSCFRKLAHVDQIGSAHFDKHVISQIYSYRIFKQTNFETKNETKNSEPLCTIQSGTIMKMVLGHVFSVHRMV